MSQTPQGSSYAFVARARKRDLPTRIGLAAFIGAAAWLLAPSVWPLAWFALMFAGQLLDDVAFRPLRRDDAEPGKRAVAVACASSTVNTTIYSAVALYLWFNGGPAGQLFAIVQVAGSLLHVCLHLNLARPSLISAVIRHSA